MGSCLGKKPKCDVSFRGVKEVNPKSDVSLGIQFPAGSFPSQINDEQYREMLAAFGDGERQQRGF